MTQPHKLHVRLGDAEFSAEGSERVVEQQYARFLEVIAGGAMSPTPPKAAKNGQQAETGVDPETLNRVFDMSDAERVSLRILPDTEDTEADALLLLLYGFGEKGQTEVNAVRIMAAARQSGIQLDRLDRTIAIHREYITQGGARRGRRYGLNNQGRNRAEEIIAGMV